MWWDDIEILRAIDPNSINGFADELDLARSAGLLTFEVLDHRASRLCQPPLLRAAEVSVGVVWGG